MTKKKFKDYPLEKSLRIPGKAEGLTVVDSDGTVKDNVDGIIYTAKRYDARVFFKLYRLGVEKIATMSLPAVRVLMYMVDNMYCYEPKEFSIDECMGYTGYKSKSYLYKALKELYKNDIVLRRKNGDYEVNPNIISNKRMFKK